MNKLETVNLLKHKCIIQSAAQMPVSTQCKAPHKHRHVHTCNFYTEELRSLVLSSVLFSNYSCNFVKCSLLIKYYSCFLAQKKVALRQGKGWWFLARQEPGSGCGSLNLGGECSPWPSPAWARLLWLYPLQLVCWLPGKSSIKKAVASWNTSMVLKSSQFSNF